ncbi:MAG: LacI family DNA-binding transcriptional regulator [Chthonomonas sp.]|nr:LacI family DNA-binding transcriptional regulator [Chthonomonas sp.]
MQSRITIQDVARKAAVSKVTVSYVLNGRDADARISPETRKRVLDAARDLGYRPSAIARMMVTQKSATIAVVFQYAQFFSVWSNFISDVMHGVSSAAVDHDYDLMLHTRAAATLDEEINQLCDGRVDGALVLRDANDPLTTALIERNFPSVLFFTRSYMPGACFVDADNFAGGRLAARHLLELGHRDIGMIRGSLNSVSSNDRFNGYRDALESVGLNVNPLHLACVASALHPLDDVEAMLARKDRPTALFVWSDDVAHKVLGVITRMGLRVPEDISLVGFDSLETSNICSPPLTSIRQPIVEMATDATNMLVSIINGHTPKKTQLVYPLTLDVRQSTAPIDITS